MEKVAKVLSGKDRAGWSTGKMKRAVQALQDVHVASTHQGASKMVLTASRTAQEKRVLSPEQKKQYFQQLARQRRLEGNQEAEQASQESMSVLDRMRGAAGRANKRDTSFGSSTANAEIRGLREEMREQMKLAPKLVIPPPQKRDDETEGFQA